MCLLDDRHGQQPHPSCRPVSRLHRGIQCPPRRSWFGGVATCATVLLLFLGEVLGRNAASILFFTFGGAIVLTMGSLAAFVAEMLFAAHGVRRVVDRSVAEGCEEAERGD